MDNIFDVYEGLHQFNDALYKATLYLEAIAKSGPFEQERMKRCRSAICRVRSETNLYLIDVIQEVERQNSQTGVRSFPQ
jgi:hypothetical protein